eukprot:TRINITY_DN773112_c0_g1_i1.p1 TRINITY_DN773112_c0_g1~~TRINITY_DN773112_c0_g1_i1.p1  ORF type:complete len:297 (-),score=91.69 TRINITY_DN773112_c0_g1_i1:138-1028(-)
MSLFGYGDSDSSDEEVAPIIQKKQPGKLNIAKLGFKTKKPVHYFEEDEQELAEQKARFSSNDNSMSSLASFLPAPKVQPQPKSEGPKPPTILDVSKLKRPSISRSSKEEPELKRAKETHSTKKNTNTGNLFSIASSSDISLDSSSNSVDIMPSLDITSSISVPTPNLAPSVSIPQPNLAFAPDQGPTPASGTKKRMSAKERRKREFMIPEGVEVIEMDAYRGSGPIMVEKHDPSRNFKTPVYNPTNGTVSKVNEPTKGQKRKNQLHSLAFGAAQSTSMQFRNGGKTKGQNKSKYGW